MHLILTLHKVKASKKDLCKKKGLGNLPNKLENTLDKKLVSKINRVNKVKSHPFKVPVHTKITRNQIPITKLQLGAKVFMILVRTFWLNQIRHCKLAAQINQLEVQRHLALPAKLQLTVMNMSIHLVLQEGLKILKILILTKGQMKVMMIGLMTCLM